VPSTPGIEIELAGGRRMRFERDADPETVRWLMALLEGGGQWHCCHRIGRPQSNERAGLAARVAGVA
jgi:hypothetical protein